MKLSQPTKRQLARLVSELAAHDAGGFVEPRGEYLMLHDGTALAAFYEGPRGTVHHYLIVERDGGVFTEDGSSRRLRLRGLSS